MDTIFPDAGLVYMLQKIVQPKVTYNLFKNDVRPGPTTVLADLQRANWSGYAPLDVLAAAWTFSGVAGHVGELRALDLFFPNLSTVPQSVYGFYILDSTGLILIAAARFDLAPVTIAPAGLLPVTPILGSFSGLTS